MSGPQEPLGPDERAVRAHLCSARFQSGVDGGRWRLISIAWPHVFVAVAAAPREGAPSEFTLRFDLTGYPQSATAGIWDCGTNALLAAGLRPKGGRVTQIFRSDWEGGRALYAAWDSVAVNTHSDWPQLHPREAWNSGRDLTFYLTNVFDLFHDDGYLGV